MLGVFILISIASTFSKIALNKNLNRYLWGAIGVVSYFLAQIIGGVVLAILNEELLNNSGAMIGINLLTGFSGVGIAYYFLQKMPDPNEVISNDNDLLDSNIE
jgi:hypothetical protein